MDPFLPFATWTPHALISTTNLVRRAVIARTPRRVRLVVPVPFTGEPIMRRYRSITPAFTIIESLIVVIVIVIMVAILLPTQGRGHHGGARQLKDSSQIRGIVQSMVVWAQSNNGRYPLPSELDTANVTVATEDDAKNTTGNILSVLIFNGYVPPEICISLPESNTAQVMRMDDYQFTNPLAAIKPDQALWDPRFRGTPLDAQIANFPTLPVANQSYAHLVPFGRRREMWRETFKTTEAVFGNRGPQYAPNDSAPKPANSRWPLVKGSPGEGSNTLLIHGGRTT